jgi:hypothetical protein
MKHFVTTLLVASLMSSACVIPTTARAEQEELIIRITEDPKDSETMIVQVSVSGTDERNIEKIVELITSLLEKAETPQSFVSANPVLALALTSVITAGITGTAVYVLTH